MKRSDRTYQASSRYTTRNQKKGSWGGVWLMILLLAAGCWYYFTQYLPEQKQESSSDYDPGDSAESSSDVEKNKKESLQIEGKPVPVETIYKIYNGMLETSAGIFEMAEEFTLYLKNEILEWENLNSLIGMEGVTLYLDEDQNVQNLQIDSTMMLPERLRILLASANGGYTHGAPEIACSTDYWVTYEEAIDTYSKKDLYVPEGDYSDGARILLKGAEEDTVWTVSDGSYHGSLELVKVDNGWQILNMVYLEPYLYSVVPSEMPDSHGAEAAKVQAVCSRSYAYTQWKNSAAYAAYGAHMDNTVNCQVYGHVLQTENSVEGVEATRGQMLIYDGQVVTANFFSTSCGMTADAGDVWANARTQEFPTSTPQYLKGRYQGSSDEKMPEDLSEESAFYRFITDDKVSSYDEKSPWYRWSAVIPQKELLDAMLPVIQEISSTRPSMVQTLNGTVFEIKPVEDIGGLNNVYVYTRAESGIITELLIEGSKQTLKICGENNIRKVMAAAGVDIKLNDGSAREDQSMLPSAFFSIEKGVNSDGELLQLTLHGGGYGHGVGMSQMGVRGMLEEGNTWEEILKHYYNEIEIGYAPA